MDLKNIIKLLISNETKVTNVYVDEKLFIHFIILFEKIVFEVKTFRRKVFFLFKKIISLKINLVLILISLPNKLTCICKKIILQLNLSYFKIRIIFFDFGKNKKEKIRVFFSQSYVAKKKNSGPKNHFFFHFLKIYLF